MASIELHPRNPRVGDVEAIAASLGRFGQVRPVLVQASTRFVVAGNHLVRAAQALGWTEIAAVVQELDDATAIAYMLTDNRTSDLGGYDDALLAAILAEQTAADNLAATGYDPADVAALLRAAGLDDRDPDAVPDLPSAAEVYVKPGELWVLGRQRLLCGDATNAADVARLLDGASPTLLATDPPYGVQLDQSWRDGAGYNTRGPAEPPYMVTASRTEADAAQRAKPGLHGRGLGHRNTTLSGDTRADWSEAFALVPSLEVGYVWYASAHTLEVLQGLLAIGASGRWARSRCTPTAPYLPRAGPRARPWSRGPGRASADRAAGRPGASRSRRHTPGTGTSDLAGAPIGSSCHLCYGD
jgi:ParB-like nuclease domain